MGSSREAQAVSVLPTRPIVDVVVVVVVVVVVAAAAANSQEQTKKLATMIYESR